MFAYFMTNGVVSNGYQETPCVYYNTDHTFARFKVGYAVYDKQAENNRRWVNVTCIAYGKTVDRIVSMDIHGGSRVNLRGRIDENCYEDKDGNKRRNLVFVVDEIEFASSMPSGEKNQHNGGDAHGNAPQGGYGQGNAPQGGYGQGNAPQGGYGQGNAPQGGYGQGNAPQGGYGQGNAPQGGYGQGNAPQGGYAPGNAPQGGYAPANAPQGGYAPGNAPQGGYAPANAPQGGYAPANAPQGGYGQGNAPQGGYSQAATPPQGYPEAVQYQPRKATPASGQGTPPANGQPHRWGHSQSGTIKADADRFMSK